MGQPEINAGIPSIMGSHWMRLHLGWSKNQELSMTGRLLEGPEAQALGLVNHMVGPGEVLDKAHAVAAELGAKPATAWRRTKARFRDVALEGFDQAFRAAVEGQREAFARGEPQAIMDAFLARRAGS
jgi:enoyl-CoA hydratase/carnithine racemase